MLTAVLLLSVLLPAYGADVRVAVASNFLSTLKILAPVYEKQTGDRLIISSASSGKLYAQIMHGAPYDLFLSADTLFPQKLIDQGKAIAETRYVYARGVLMLASTDHTIHSLDELSHSSIKHIAIANPDIAPYGVAAYQTLQKAGMWSPVKERLVKGENVSQAFQFIVTGNAQVGFVAASHVLQVSKQMSLNYWQVPQAYYSPIEQEAVLLHSGKEKHAAKAFLEFLKSDQARRLIIEHGYR